ncbi:MAG: amidohydrolase [Leptospiraceae bacterium]|nr:MAG: amidohydrolase [Leptospiraceae bacterium]
MNYLNNLKKEELSIGLLQYEIHTKEPMENINKISHLLGQKNNDIIVLPEMGITGFSLKRLDHFLNEVEYYLKILKELANTYNTAICTTLPYKEGNFIYNRLFFILPDGEMYWYDKHYLIDWGGFNEGKYFSQGNSFLVIKYFGWIIGFAICYDLRFPELFYYMNKYSYEKYNDFIKLFLIPVQWPNRRIHHFTLLSKARAVENLAIVAATNNIGRMGELEFNGRSIVVDPDGNELLLIENYETLENCKINYKIVDSIQKDRPILLDRYKKNWY